MNIKKWIYTHKQELNQLKSLKAHRQKVNKALDATRHRLRRLDDALLNEEVKED